jgi:hypothetical protein
MSCSWNEICSWKDQKKTITFLICLNVTYLSSLYFKTSLLSLLLQFLFFKSLFGITNKKLNLNLKICESESDQSTQEENIQKLYCLLYDELNKYCDKLRNIILLNDYENLFKLVICLLFFITIGNMFSTLTIIILGINIYVLLQYKSFDEKLKDSYNLAMDMTKKLVIDKIPKYNDAKIEKID